MLRFIFLFGGWGKGGVEQVSDYGRPDRVKRERGMTKKRKRGAVAEKQIQRALANRTP